MAKKHILVVDDDPLISRMYEHKLTADGYDVDTAPDGKVALEKIQSKKPDLILLDVMMPKLNGVETLKAIKAEKKFSHVPVIFLTNLTDNADDVKNAKELGALDYLVKADTSLKQLSERVAKTV
jgi:DNA-binding response OmpR family regulator